MHTLQNRTLWVSELGPNVFTYARAVTGGEEGQWLWSQNACLISELLTSCVALTTWMLGLSVPFSFFFGFLGQGLTWPWLALNSLHS